MHTMILQELVSSAVQNALNCTYFKMKFRKIARPMSRDPVLQRLPSHKVIFTLKPMALFLIVFQLYHVTVRQLLRISFLHSFILFQTTEVHRHTHNTYIYRRKNTHRETEKETKHTHKTRRTISLSQTDSLLAKLTLELCIKVLKLGSPRSNSIFVTLSVLWISEKKHSIHLE